MAELVTKKRIMLIALVIFGLASMTFVVFSISFWDCNRRQWANELSDNLSRRLAKNEIVEETRTPEDSSSATWWLSSGARFVVSDGIGHTMQGDALPNDPWRCTYVHSNPIDTDYGLHPQNIFRLIDKSESYDVSQSVYFRINRLQLSASPNRNASNGLFLISRYEVTNNNAYYAGLRVDGYAIIKKKIKGVYTTLAQQPIVDGAAYNRTSHPNLLPVGSWLGVKSEVETLEDGTVRLRLYTDMGRTGIWTLALETVDGGLNGAVLDEAGHVGIRTDFMDAELDGRTIKAMSTKANPERPRLQ